MRTALLVAFHFPPQFESSGMQRTLRLAQYLPEFGWKPVVLTVTGDVYESSAPESLANIPAHVQVERVACFDAKVRFSVAGRYPTLLDIPDRWFSWIGAALRQMPEIMAHHKPDLVWSTFPIASAHAIGAKIQHRYGIPWVADFRDPMLQHDFPAGWLRRHVVARIERSAARRARFITTTTPSSSASLRNKYARREEQVLTIENGFDDSIGLLDNYGKMDRLNPGKITLLHSGIVYPDLRNPRPLLEALKTLKASQSEFAETLRLRFRAAGHEEFLRSEVRARNLEGLVQIMPPIPYREALEEMSRADGLILMQGASANRQIPAKLYEYLQARRPILGLTSRDGDAATTLLGLGYRDIAPLESVDEIVTALPDFVTALLAGEGYVAETNRILSKTRRAGAKQFASLFDAALNPAAVAAHA